MSSPARPLGPTEQLFWLSDQVGTFNFVVAAEVAGRLDPEALRKGLAALQRRHALLSVGIDGGRFNPAYTTDGVGPLDLRVAEVPWEARRAELEREMNTRIPTQPGPLARFALLRHEPPRQTLLVTFNHVIGDARSGVTLLRELLEQHQEPERELEPLPPLREPEAYFPWWARGLWRRLVLPIRVLRLLAPLFPRIPRLPAYDGWAPLAERRVAVVQLRLGGDVLGRLKARSKQEGTTIHGALAAAQNLAMQEEIAAGRTVGLAIAHPVDLRARLSPELMVGQVGLLQGVAITGHKVHSQTSFWELARGVKAQLTRCLERGQHLTVMSEAISVARWVQLLLLWGRRGVHRFLRAFQSTTLPSCGLSNIGLADLAPTYGEVQVKALEFCSALSGVGYTAAFAATAGDCLSWNFVLMEPVYTREHLARIATRAQEILEAAIEAPAARTDPSP